jgi:hypothetical protein
MGQLLDTAIEFLRQQGWSFIQLDGQAVLEFRFTGSTASWNCYVQSKEPQARLICYSVAPRPAPEARCMAMAELVARANYGLVIGNFELDMEDGEVRYKTSIDVSGASITVALIRTLVHVNVRAMNHYLPAIEAVIDGAPSPRALIAELEGQVPPTGP